MAMVPVMAWIRMALVFLHYFAFKLGMAKMPNFMARREDAWLVVENIYNYKKRLRYTGEDNYPHQGVHVFAANHARVDDPFTVFGTAYRASGIRLLLYGMMRDGFFDGTIFKSRMLDMDEVLSSCGILSVSRGKVQMRQMKPFIQALEEGHSFFLFPGGTRSLSGLFMEYRGDLTEPGGVSFFPAMVQRRLPDAIVGVVPMARSYNPVENDTLVTIGKPMYLAANASRAEQREMDFQLIENMAALVKIDVAHVLAAYLYLNALHGKNRISLEETQDRTRDVLQEFIMTSTDPAAMLRLEKQIMRALKYFEKHEMLSVNGPDIELNKDSVLASPPVDRAYKRVNPIKYLTNQLLHLKDETAAIERAVLGTVAALEKESAA